MTVDDLVKLIKDSLVAGGVTTVPVVLPGTSLSVLPCVVIAPSDDALGEGNRTLRHGFDVTVAVPRGAQVSQYPRLVELLGLVLRGLVPSAVRFEGPIVFAATGGGDTGEPPAMVRIVPVSFASDVALC